MSRPKALITGASTGIGKVYAQRLARRGYDLVLVARDKTRLDALAEQLRQDGAVSEVLVADLTQSGDVARIEQKLEGDAAISFFLNNAGIATVERHLQTSLATIENLIALNITAATRLALAAGRAFVAQKRGIIVNMCSITAVNPERFNGVYGGSKAYLLALSQALTKDLNDNGVTIQAVLPGATRTEIWERSGKDVDAFPAEWVMEVGPLVDAALVGLDKGETVTIPPLADEGQFTTFNDARLAMQPFLSRRDVAARYLA